jgi:transcriptional regulator with XRE-family HTH domain
MLYQLRHIGAMMKARRRELRLTQRELARRLGTSQAYISRVEDGRISPSIEVADAIAHTLDFETILAPRSDADRVRSLLDSSGLKAR